MKPKINETNSQAIIAFYQEHIKTMDFNTLKQLINEKEIFITNEFGRKEYRLKYYNQDEFFSPFAKGADYSFKVWKQELDNTTKCYVGLFKWNQKNKTYELTSKIGDNGVWLGM